MVWFQCEDCGENLKKPKLPNHFRCCSAFKLSCIDCGVTFTQESVQGHNQCITEAEKYGPKGLGKASTTPKAKTNAKKNQDIDINVGLSEHPPWFCRLCNTNATSQQTLLLHADGKKHRAKARAIHAANQPPKQTEESTPSTNISSENIQKDEIPSNKNAKQSNGDQTKVTSENKSSEPENGNILSNMKRKLDQCENEHVTKKVGELGNGKAISAKEDSKKKIKWKKLITSALKSSPDGVLKMRKLKKLVLEAIQESGITEDEVQLSNTLEHQIVSSSRFAVDKKYVRLVSKD